MNTPKITEKTFNFVSTLTPRASTKRIIIHHTGGADIDASAEQIHSWHLDAQYAGIGYHFVIRKSGEIERGRPQWAIGSHAYGANIDSIGIHLSGEFSYNAPTNAQIESCASLIAWLCEQYNIPTDRKHILGHREVIATECPGNVLFNLLEVITGKALWHRYNTADVVDTPYIKVKLYPRAGLLTEHFGESEFTCKHCGKKIKIDEKLLELLEQLRYNIGGYPLYINSGYRCNDCTKAFCGSADYLHKAGKAVDVAIPAQLSYGQFKWYIEQLPFDGICYFKDRVHLDTRNGGAGTKIIRED